MRKVFLGFAMLLLFAVLGQFFLAAMGAFDSAPNDESFSAHRTLGYLILLLAVLTTVVAAAARVPGQLVGMAALIAGLTLTQSIIRGIASSFNDSGDTTTTAAAAIFGLHALVGLGIMALAGYVVRQARTLALPTAEAAEVSGSRHDGG